MHPTVLLQRLLVVAQAVVVVVTQRHVRLDQIGREPQRLVHGWPGRLEHAASPELRVDPDERSGERRIGVREPGIELHRSLVQFNRGPGVLLDEAAGVAVVAAQVVVVGLQVRGRRSGECAVLASEQGDVERPRHALGDVGLDSEDLRQDRVVRPRPDVCVVGDPDELRGHADPALAPGYTLPVDGAFEHVLDIQFVADLSDTLFCILVLDRRRARDDAEFRYLR